VRSALTRSSLLGLGLGFALAAGPALGGEVYSFLDADGVVHYRVEGSEPSTRRQTRLRGPGVALPSTAAGVALPAQSARSPAPESADTPPSIATPPPDADDLPEAELPLRAAVPPEPAVEAGPEPGVEAPAEPLSESARQIAELEAQIARDRETLKTLISEGQESGRDISLDPRVREIAERLPRLQSELAALRAEPAP
jgi:hypothetical protein